MSLHPVSKSGGSPLFQPTPKHAPAVGSAITSLEQNLDQVIRNQEEIKARRCFERSCLTGIELRETIDQMKTLLSPEQYQPLINSAFSRVYNSRLALAILKKSAPLLSKIGLRTVDSRGAPAKIKDRTEILSILTQEASAGTISQHLLAAVIKVDSKTSLAIINSTIDRTDMLEVFNNAFILAAGIKTSRFSKSSNKPITNRLKEMVSDDVLKRSLEAAILANKPATISILGAEVNRRQALANIELTASQETAKKRSGITSLYRRITGSTDLVTEAEGKVKKYRAIITHACTVARKKYGPDHKITRAARRIRE
jgi:hypothetical protein